MTYSWGVFSRKKVEPETSQRPIHVWVWVGMSRPWPRHPCRVPNLNKDRGSYLPRTVPFSFFFSCVDHWRHYVEESSSRYLKWVSNPLLLPITIHCTSWTLWDNTLFRFSSDVPIERRICRTLDSRMFKRGTMYWTSPVISRVVTVTRRRKTWKILLLMSRPLSPWVAPGSRSKGDTRKFWTFPRL